MPHVTVEHSQNLASMLLEELDRQRTLMTDVATGGPRIDSVNEDYVRRRERLREGIARLALEDPNPHADLWAWYEKWSSGDLPTYRSRRQYLRELYAPLIAQLERVVSGIPAGPQRNPTSWPRVDRGIDKMRLQLSAARDPEDFQAVGLLAREVLISLAQAVYDPELHRSPDGVVPSGTDADRMLSSCIEAELRGHENEALRRHAKASLVLAVALQHRRTADFRMAALCSEATASVVNIMSIVSGRRDPSTEDDVT